MGRGMGRAGRGMGRGMGRAGRAMGRGMGRGMGRAGRAMGRGMVNFRSGQVRHPKMTSWFVPLMIDAASRGATAR
jgi:hypothetical protein